MLLVISLLVPLLTVLRGARTQTTGATCEVGYEWMFNSKEQSPCLVSSYLYSACSTNPNDAYIQALVPNDGDYYSIPTTAVSPCFCNTVFYSVIGACSYCQGDRNLDWDTYRTNCSTVFTGSFPKPIPSGTAIPAWAYMDVVTPNAFNITAAEALANQDEPDSTALGPPVSTISSRSSTSSIPLTAFSSVPASPPSSSVTPTPVSAAIKTSKTNVGAIVGGVVGGIAGLAIIGGLLFWLLRRNRDSSKRAPSAEFYVPAQQQPPPSPLPEKTISSSPSAYVPQFTATPPPPARFYNPDDPLTFPSAMDDAVTVASSPVSVPNTQTSFQQHGASTYSGVPEL